MPLQVKQQPMSFREEPYILAVDISLRSPPLSDPFVSHYLKLNIQASENMHFDNILVKLHFLVSRTGI